MFSEVFSQSSSEHDSWDTASVREVDEVGSEYVAEFLHTETASRFLSRALTPGSLIDYEDAR